MRDVDFPYTITYNIIFIISLYMYDVLYLKLHVLWELRYVTSSSLVPSSDFYLSDSKPSLQEFHFSAVLTLKKSLTEH